jgi:molybdenum-dependent DNA-binding transcriptional regulator ModE
MSENGTQNKEIRRIRRLLQKTAEMAEGASLTGSLKQGGRAAALQYNRALQHLEQLGEIPTELFAPLPEDASLDEVGVAANQLAGYLEDEEEGSSPATAGGESHGSHNNVFIGLGGLKELEQLKGLGQAIRDQMPDWIKNKMGGEVEQPEENGATLTEVESRLVEVGARLQTVAEQLRRGDLTDGQRAELAEQLSRLGQEQAQLARRHAALRQGQEAAASAEAAV